jgi:hypothetical protein
MDNKLIYKILNNDEYVKELNFLGVFPRDLIPLTALRQQPCCMVVNTKPHSHPGDHWVAVVKTEDNNGIYFDSYGQPPYNLEEVGMILDSCVDWYFNDVKLQSPFSSVCGPYTIFFLTHYARGYSLKHISHLLNEGDLHANDAFIFNYIKEMYPYDTVQSLKVIDFPFNFKQTSQITS